MVLRPVQPPSRGYHAGAAAAGSPGGSEGDPGGEEQAGPQALGEGGRLGEHGAKDSHGQGAADLAAGVEDAAGHTGLVAGDAVEQDRGHRWRDQGAGQADQDHQPGQRPDGHRGRDDGDDGQAGRHQDQAAGDEDPRAQPFGEAGAEGGQQGADHHHGQECQARGQR
jgi:hypothetical protein